MGKSLKGKELGAGFYQRKDGKYCGRFYDRFGVRRYIYGKTITEAREKLNTAIYEDKMQMNVADNSITLDEWYHKWLEIHKYKIIAPSTRVQYEGIYKKHIKPDFGQMKLKDIQALQIRGKLVSLDKEGFGYETQNKVRILLLDMFDKAVLDNVAIKNPVRKIKVVRDEEKEPRVLSSQEQSEFFDTCKGTFYDNLFTVGVTSGLRPGDDDDKIRLNQRKPSKYKGLSRFGPEKNLQRINKFMKERPTFYKKLIQMKENFRFYLRCFYCITKVVILQFNSEKQDRISS